MMRSKYIGRFTLGNLLACLIVMGCESSPPPMSYQEALEIHKSEVELLNSLKSRRLELSNSLSQVGAGGLADSAAELAGTLLNGAGEHREKVDATLEQLSGLKDVLPEESRAAASDAAQSADKLSQHLSNQVEDLKKQSEEKRQKLEQEIAELDKQIVAQEQKVARALADKEKAESRRK